MRKAQLTLAAILLSALTLAALYSLPPQAWEGWAPATCLQTGCFCEEADASSPVRQPANTASSLGFVLSGALMLLPPARHSRFTKTHAAIMGISVIIIGVGSAFYHASLTFSGQFFDILGMFMLAVFMLVHAFQRILSLRLAAALGLFLAINLILTGLQVALPDTRRYVFAVVLVIALLFEAYYRRKATPSIRTRLLHTGVALLALAYIIWILDNTRTLCLETSLLQGHALWHLLGAASTWFLYRYYVSETAQKET